MHAPIAMAAMSMGKPVYVQKPLALTIRETRMLALKARQANLVTQMGIQISSHETQLVTEQLIATARSARSREVHTFCDKAWGDTNPIPAGADPVPQTLDWDGWIGVSEPRPFKGRSITRATGEARRLRHRHARRHGLPHLQHAARGVASRCRVR